MCAGKGLKNVRKFFGVALCHQLLEKKLLLCVLNLTAAIRVQVFSRICQILFFFFLHSFVKFCAVELVKCLQ